MNTEFMNNFMNTEKKMTNCPKCQKPILNEGIFTSPAKFNMRCPWCHATLEINIQPKIITEVIKLANGETYKPQEKQDNIDNHVFSPKHANSNINRTETEIIEKTLAENYNNTPNLKSTQPPDLVRSRTGRLGSTEGRQKFKLVGYLYPEELEPKGG